MGSRLEDTHYIENVGVCKCIYCGHELHGAGKINTRKGVKLIRYVYYCSSCKKYFRVYVEECPEDYARDVGFSVA